MDQISTSILQFLQHSLASEVDKKSLRREIMHSNKLDSGQKKAFKASLTMLVDEGHVVVDERTEIVKLNVSDANTTETAVSPLAALCNSIIQLILEQNGSSMKRKSLRHTVMKPYTAHFDVEQRHTVFNVALNELVSAGRVLLDYESNTVTVVVENEDICPAEQTVTSTSNKKQKLTHNVGDDTYNAYTHIKEEPDTSNSDPICEQTQSSHMSLSDVILQVLSRQSYPDKRSLRKTVYTVYQGPPSSSTNSKSDRKKEFKKALRELIDKELVKKEDGGYGIVQVMTIKIDESAQNNKYITWPQYLDDKLIAAVELLGMSDWLAVSQHLNENKSGQSCHKRWKEIQSGAADTLREGKWEEDEASTLLALVPQHVKLHKGDVVTDWVTIGKLMNRNSKTCCSKFQRINMVKNSKLTTGVYTTEEDDIIRQRVAEKGEDDKSLWKELSNELNRDFYALRKHWNTIRGIKNVRKVHYWTEEMDAKLVSAYNIFGGNWKLVAEHVGGDFDSNHCCSRWYRHVDPVQANRYDGPWTEEEVEKLTALVKTHYKTLKTGRMVISWKEIGREMNRKDADCKDKWNDLCYSTMKHGSFTADEDRIIQKRVLGWGQKTKLGLWTSISNELNRPQHSIRNRWTQTLRHREK